MLPKWTDFEEGTFPPSYPYADGERVFLNSRYQVYVRRFKPTVPDAPDLVHLSIKRRDKAPVGAERYRDFELIKDTFIGPECEAVEVYPARSREADSANQYHLWGIDSAEFRFPFGFEDRLVTDQREAEATGARQQPFEPHHPR